jgi:membrane-bound serine protease (ClpP class)
LTKNILQVLGSLLSAVLVSFLFLRYALPRLGTVIDGPYLSATLEKARANSSETMRVSVGDCGTALTLLRPSGKVKIGSRIVDAITEGEFLEKNVEVIVAAIKGNRIIVERKID